MLASLGIGLRIIYFNRRQIQCEHYFGNLTEFRLIVNTIIFFSLHDEKRDIEL